MLRGSIGPRLLALVAAVGCGPTGGDAPAFLELEDHSGVVGREIFFEVRAADPELTALRFGLDGSAPTASSASLTPAGNGSSAIFRWTPTAADVGLWIFDFRVSDGVHETVESVAIAVDQTAGDAPVFRQPLGAGTTFDLADGPCVTLAIHVDDPDSSFVEVTQGEPLIEGATLSEAPGGYVWEWCPTGQQAASGDSFVLTLTADDGEHQTTKHFLVVLRNGPLIEPVDLSGFVLHQAGASCQFELPGSFEVERGSTVIIARDASRAEFEAFWGEPLGASVIFFSSGDSCPRINGDESYVLVDAAGDIVDGPTPVMFEHENFQRIKGALPADDLDSWDIISDLASPSPGFAPRDPEVQSVYISEYSDASGTGSFIFEFVEIAVD